MKFSVNRPAFTEAVSIVSRAVSPKSTLAVLEGVLLRARQGQLTLCGYDLELGITTSLSCQVEEEGELVLPARMLLDMARRMPEEDLCICSDAKYLTQLKSGATEYTILGMPAEDFPELPEVRESTSLSLGQPVLRSMIEQTLFAVATTDLKPVHTGSLFSWEEGVLTVVSVDGYRLAVRRERVAGGQPMRFVVPGKALAEIGRILSAEGEEETVLDVSKKHIQFSIGPYQVFSRLLEGDFIDYRTALPKQASTRVRIQVRPVVDAIERASLLINDRVKSPLRMRFEEGVLHLSCTTSLGRAYDQAPVQQEGEDLEIGFNSRYVLDALKAAGTDQVRLQLAGPLSPMTVLPVEGEDFLFLVLPVRLKAEG